MTPKPMPPKPMTLEPMRRTLHILLLTGLLTGGAHAELYKWVDENGRTHYSDKVRPAAGPGARIVELPADTAPLVAVTPEPATDPLADRQALMRDPSWQLPRIVVTATPLADTRQDVGVMRAGELCRNIAPLYWPDIRQQRPYLVPDSQQLAGAAARALAQFDYPALEAALANALTQQRRSGGPLLQLQPVHLQLDACAPDTYASQQAYEADAVTRLNFRRHQLQLTLGWVLTSADGKTLFTSQTNGKAGNLQHNGDSNRVYSAAVEQAVMQLLANPAFRTALQQVAATGQPVVTPPAAAADSGWGLSQLFPDNLLPANLQPQTWQHRASLAAILATMSQIKIPMTEYYFSEGEWPTRFEQMQVEVAPSVQGATLMLQPGGLLVARLPDSFGTGREIHLRGPSDPTVIGAEWTCATNVDERPEACTGL